MKTPKQLEDSAKFAYISIIALLTLIGIAL